VIVHLAAVIPPQIHRGPVQPRNPHHQTELLRADTPARPFEHYRPQKQEAEEIVRSSNLAWVVLRLVSVDPAAMPFSASGTDEIQRHLA
jgi:uncharacterized protein YbjT (DUF2867 family)